jgi:hypothetical protein
VGQFVNLTSLDASKNFLEVRLLPWHRRVLHGGGCRASQGLRASGLHKCTQLKALNLASNSLSDKDLFVLGQAAQRCRCGRVEVLLVTPRPPGRFLPKLQSLSLNGNVKLDKYKSDIKLLVLAIMRQQKGVNRAPGLQFFNGD